MDDRDLDGRLQANLHRRFDTAEPSAELRASVEQVFAMRPRPVGLAQTILRPRPLRLSLLAAAAAIAVVTVFGPRLGGLIGPSGPQPTATPGPTTLAPLERRFLVMPPTKARPSKEQSILATEVLTKRLATLGFPSIVSASGFAIEFQLPVDGPSDDIIRAVLAATGDVRFVPLSTAVAASAVVGEPLPANEPALFGWEGIALVTADMAAPEGPRISIVLQPAAADAFGTWTEAYVGGTFAIVIDGRVALLPTVNAPILDGKVNIAPARGEKLSVTAAILVGGMLPEAWARPVVPVLLPADQVVASVMREAPGATLESAELDVIPSTETYGWLEVWRIELSGDLPAPCPSPTGGSAPVGPCYTKLLVTVDASSGEPVSTQYMP